jgi:hypothetical protein
LGQWIKEKMIEAGNVTSILGAVREAVTIMLSAAAGPRYREDPEDVAIEQDDQTIAEWKEVFDKERVSNALSMCADRIDRQDTLTDPTPLSGHLAHESCEYTELVKEAEGKGVESKEDTLNRILLVSNLHSRRVERTLALQHFWAKKLAYVHALEDDDAKELRGKMVQLDTSDRSWMINMGSIDNMTEEGARSLAQTIGGKMISLGDMDTMDLETAFELSNAMRVGDKFWVEGRGIPQGRSFDEVDNTDANCMTMEITKENKFKKGEMACDNMSVGLVVAMPKYSRLITDRRSTQEFTDSLALLTRSVISAVRTLVVSAGIEKFSTVPPPVIDIIKTLEEHVPARIMTERHTSDLLMTMALFDQLKQALTFAMEARKREVVEGKMQGMISHTVRLPNIFSSMMGGEFIVPTSFSAATLAFTSGINMLLTAAVIVAYIRKHETRNRKNGGKRRCMPCCCDEQEGETRTNEEEMAPLRR